MNALLSIGEIRVVEKGAVSPPPQKKYRDGKLIILNGSVNCNQFKPSPQHL